MKPGLIYNYLTKYFPVDAILLLLLNDSVHLGTSCLLYFDCNRGGLVFKHDCSTMITYSCISRDAGVVIVCVCV